MPPISPDETPDQRPLAPKTLPELRSLSKAQLDDAVHELGIPSFRAKQIVDWAWARGVGSFDEMTNLPAALRDNLAGSYSVALPEEVVKQVSRDGSRKYLLRFADGASVECVGMPNRGKLAVCVSSQAGCGMRCAFCATGAAGLRRSLTPAQIFEQVSHVQKDFLTRVTSVVVMGQGEPFANYDATLAALRWINSPEGLGVGSRHITVSTCGILPMIKRFSHEPEQFTLAVSLHSAVQQTRNAIMPGVHKYSLLRLHDAMADYVETSGRRPTYEYALMAGVNDTENELAALVDFCRGTVCHVNIIQLNEVEGSPFRPSTAERAEQFISRLERAGVEATIRNSRGADIDAACGQLKQRLEQGK